MCDQLEFLASQRLLKSANWVEQLFEFDVVRDVFEEDMCNKTFEPNADIFDILRYSKDADEIMSAIILTLHDAYVDQLGYGTQLVHVINDLPIERWIWLFKIRSDVALECTKILIMLFDENSPTNGFIDAIAPVIRSDMNIANRIVNVWRSAGWGITPVFVRAIRDSNIAWKLLSDFEPRSSPQTSFTVMSKILSPETRKQRLAYLELVKLNYSCMDYLLSLDMRNANGIETTFKTIKSYNLWHIVFQNPGIGPIIEYSLDNFWKLNNHMSYSKNMTRSWILSLLKANPISYKYVTLQDYFDFKVSPMFFHHVNSLPLIKQLVNPIDDEDRFVTEEIVYGLVSIASSYEKESALKAIDVLRNWITDCELQKEHWVLLLKSPYANEYAKNVLYRKREDLLNYIMKHEGMLPSIVLEPVQNDNDEWYISTRIHNLDENTVLNIKYSNETITAIQNNVDVISLEDWIILLKCPFGIQFGIRNINYLIDQDALPDLLTSTFLTPDEIVKLSKSNAFEEAMMDNELLALLCRPDAYTVDYENMSMIKKELNQELMSTWFEPNRLIRIAFKCNMHMREYLNLVA